MESKGDLVLGLFQMDIVWESPAENRKKIENALLACDPKPDLLLLPEMFTTGFTMNAQTWAESMEGESISWMKQVTQEQNVALGGSLIIEEGGKFYNRFVLMKTNGDCEVYDKRHLFAFAGEDQYYTGGVERQIVELNGWEICLQVCYDLRFPVWSRNRGDYDLLVYVANWPEKRAIAWDALLPARAHENQAFVAGLNRVGKDGKGMEYVGGSTVYSAKGEKLLDFDSGEEAVKTVRLNYEELERFRSKFPVFRDADQFDIKTS